MIISYIKSSHCTVSSQYERAKASFEGQVKEIENEETMAKDSIGCDNEYGRMVGVECNPATHMQMIYQIQRDNSGGDVHLARHVQGAEKMYTEIKQMQQCVENASNWLFNVTKAMNLQV